MNLHRTGSLLKLSFSSNFEQPIEGYQFWSIFHVTPRLDEKICLVQIKVHYSFHQDLLVLTSDKDYLFQSLSCKLQAALIHFPTLLLD